MSNYLEAPIQLNNRYQNPTTQANLESTAPQHDNSNILDQDSAVTQQLSPADGGLRAWRLLIAAFVFEALLWGEHWNSQGTP